jgi:uncharacterized OsmC-like protein
LFLIVEVGRVIRPAEQKEKSMKATTETITTKINGVETDRLFQTAELIRANTGLAAFQFRLQNNWMTGGLTRSRTRGFSGAGQEIEHVAPFELKSDEPEILLGTDQAPNAGEYLLHALVACVTSAIVYHAAARGIAIEKIESSIKGDVDLRGFLGLDPSVRNGFGKIEINFRIKADVSDTVLQEICDLGPKYSPVYDSVTNGVPVKVSAERLR